MRIQAINSFNINSKKSKQQTPKTAPSPTTNNLLLEGYKDFNLSFKARLNRTPENFYAQQFNIDNMPDTVKKYLFEDFEQRHHMPPAQLQRQAFEYLKIADSVQDIKDMYPDEPLFAHLKELKDTKPSQGILLLLKWDAQTSQTPIFKDPQNKDLTTYLLKKVYLEGKTNEELNNDFDNDATDAIKRELGVKDKRYFSQTNIYTLGIRYPKLPYYNSFLATRNDKEYIPPVRKSGVTPSEETKEKLSAAMTKWWAGLNEMERSEQIQKMLYGKEMANSIFAKYQGQIMTIAAAQMGFSEKLSDIFAQKYADADFTIDFPTFSEQQREIMLEFWNKDPEFRTKYSQALQETIAEFENAYYSEDKTELENLLNKALDLKAKVLNRAKEKQYIKREMQKLAQPAQPQQPQKPEPPAEPEITPKTANKLFRQQEYEAMKFFTDDFKKEMLEFLMQKVNNREKMQLVMLNRENAQELLKMNDEEFEALQKEMADKTEGLNAEFNLSHTLIAKTNDFVLNKLMYKYSGDPQAFICERADSVNGIKLHKLEQNILSQKAAMNLEMKNLLQEQKRFKSVFFSKSIFKKLTEKDQKIADYMGENFARIIGQKITYGFNYYPDLDKNMLANMQKNLIVYGMDVDKINNFLVKNYASLSFITDTNNDAQARDAALEHLIVDYTLHVLSLQKQNLQKTADYNNEEANVKRDASLDKGYNIDYTSLYSLKYGFKQYLHKNTTKYWAGITENQILEYTDAYPNLNKEALATILAIKLDKFKNAFKHNTIADRRKDQNFANTLINILYDDFAQKFPKTANANNAALNYVLYELTQNPKALTIQAINAGNFIRNNHMERRITEKQNLLTQKYNEYLQPLSDKDIQNFYDKEFYPMLSEVLESDEQFDAMYNPENFEQAQKLILNAFFTAKQDITAKQLQYLKDNSAFIKLMNEDSYDEDLKEMLLEKLAVDYVRSVASKINKNVE